MVYFYLLFTKVDAFIVIKLKLLSFSKLYETPRIQSLHS